MTSNTANLSVESVTKKFDGLTANAQISFGLDGGEFIGLVGPNGAGKSTLVEIIGGRLAPDSGAIRFNGEDITRVPSHERAVRGLGRTFQGGSLFPEFTVLANLMIGGYAQSRKIGACRFMFRSPVARAAIRSTEKDATEVAHRIGIESLLTRRAADLSRGEQQLVALGIVMAGEPRVLVLDEPLAGLERAEITRLLEVLGQLRLEDKAGVLMVEHNLEVVRQTCERLIVLDQGRIIASGPPATVLAESAVQEAYLGVQPEVDS